MRFREININNDTSVVLKANYNDVDVLIREYDGNDYYDSKLDASKVEDWHNINLRECEAERRDCERDLRKMSALSVLTSILSFIDVVGLGAAAILPMPIIEKIALACLIIGSRLAAGFAVKCIVRDDKNKKLGSRIINTLKDNRTLQGMIRDKKKSIRSEINDLLSKKITINIEKAKILEINRMADEYLNGKNVQDLEKNNIQALDNVYRLDFNREKGKSRSLRKK